MTSALVLGGLALCAALYARRRALGVPVLPLNLRPSVLQRHASSESSGTRRIVALFSAAFDPISSNELRMAAELCNIDIVDAVLLVPFGSEYRSCDGARGGLTALSRFTLCSLGVESTLPSTCPVSVVHPRMHSKSTPDILHEIGSWAADNEVDLLWVTVTLPDAAGLCDVQLRKYSDQVPGSVDLLLSTTATHAGFVTARAAMAASSFSDRVKSQRQYSIYGLVPPLVMSAIKRYGLYDSRSPVAGPWSSVGWYQDGWSRFACIREPDESFQLGEDAADSPFAPVDAFDESDDDARITRSISDVRFLGRKKNNRIAIFGGSFSPIAVHHLEVAAELVNTGTVDEVWVVPCGPRPDKPSLDVDVHLRYVQCVLAVESFVSASVPIFVVPAEIPHAKALSSSVTLFSYCVATRLSSLFPSHTFELVIGTDLVPTLPKWRHSRRLVNECCFVIVERPGVAWKPTAEATSLCYRHMSVPKSLSICLTELSSTEVRSRVKRSVNAVTPGRCTDWSLAGLLPLPVLGFVNRYGLYGLKSTTLTPL